MGSDGWSGQDKKKRGRAAAEALAVWQSFLEAHAWVTARLGTELAAVHGLSLIEYEVLVQLSTSDGHGARMYDLATRLCLSRSGLTRIVDRLECNRLVIREHTKTDKRGRMAVLTWEGQQRLHKAIETHLPSVARYFSSLFTADELRMLQDLCQRLIATNQ